MLAEGGRYDNGPSVLRSSGSHIGAHQVVICFIEVADSGNCFSAVESPSVPLGISFTLPPDFSALHLRQGSWFAGGPAQSEPSARVPELSLRRQLMEKPAGGF